MVICILMEMKSFCYLFYQTKKFRLDQVYTPYKSDWDENCPQTNPRDELHSISQTVMLTNIESSTFGS